ncbi:MAG: stage II sporulation protein P [Oscillospiraceae bacterium]|nr:stage II sporulation protein P [Oscillospiraceae bacterium]
MVKTANRKKNGKNFSFPAKIIVLTGILGTFFAAALFTPISGVLSAYLQSDFMRNINSFNNEEDSPRNAAAVLPNKSDIGRAILSLSFAGVQNIYNSDSPSAGAFDGSQVNQSASSQQDTSGSLSNPYENTPAADDDSMASIQEMYQSYQLSSGVDIGDADPTNPDNLQLPADTYKITAVNMSEQKTKAPKLLLLNDTSYNINLDNYISRPYPIEPFDTQKKDEPVVLILDTHTTESYVEDGTYYYAPAFTAPRSEDPDKSVVLVATELANKLEQYGIPVVQSTKIHDEPSFQNSYIRSLETMKEYLQKYPSIKYVVDLHRDAIMIDTGEQYKPTIKVNGRNCAQVMLVVGTPDGGGSNPHWQDNLTYATYLYQKMNDKYPMLARPINLRAAIFNESVTKGSILMEVGSCGSTFTEAVYAADLVGECMADVILEHNS